MSRLPLYSSQEIINALKRDGFEFARKSKRGSHQTMKKKMSERTRVVVVVIGEKEIPRGTFKSILAQAGLSEEDFLKLL